MLKRKLTCIVIVSAITAAICGCGKQVESTQPTPSPAATKEAGSVVLGYEKTYEEFIDGYDSAKVVLIGKVEKSENKVINSLPNTILTVKVDKILRGNYSEKTINICYSGGEIDGEVYNANGVVIPDKDSDYLFLLDEKREGEDDYFPLGGYQGTYKVSGKTADSTVEEFNTNNIVEGDIIGKKLSDITDIE